MPIMIAIPDDCKPLAEAVERLVALHGARDPSSRRRSRRGLCAD